MPVNFSCLCVIHANWSIQWNHFASATKLLAHRTLQSIMVSFPCYGKCKYSFIFFGFQNVFENYINIFSVLGRERRDKSDESSTRGRESNQTWKWNLFNYLTVSRFGEPSIPLRLFKLLRFSVPPLSVRLRCCGLSGGVLVPATASSMFDGA